MDPVFQAKMLDMLKQVGRPEMVVGWYHSHPGFGCWLSGVDINTQQSFEALSERAVAVVVDPIQSVKGRHIKCFFKERDFADITFSIPVLFFIWCFVYNCNHTFQVLSLKMHAVFNALTTPCYI